MSEAPADTLPDQLNAELSSLPFLFEYCTRHNILLVVNRSGKIIWGYNPGGTHIYAGAIHFMLQKTIQDFFDFPASPEGILANPESADLQSLKAFYASGSWRAGPAYIPSLRSYPSRNVFENKFEDYNFTTRIPMSHVRFVRAGAEYGLGIISFNDNIKNFLRWQNDWKSDINVLCDSRRNILGYDGKFAQVIKAKEQVLGKPLDLFLSSDNPPEESGLPQPGRNETRLFTFPGGKPSQFEFSRKNLFSITAQGLVCDAGNNEVPAFVNLPVKTDFERYDYRVELAFTGVEKEMPICILNGSDLIEGVFPDAYGLLLAPIHDGLQHRRSGTLSFILKWGGEIVSVFHDVPAAPAPGTEKGYIVVKQGRAFRFYINGKYAGAHSAEDLPVKPGSDNIVFGLRQGSRAIFTAIRVTRAELSPDKSVSARRTAFFKNDLRKVYKVNSFFYPYADSPVGLNYLRLEDLDAREKISRLLQTQKQQEAEIERLKKGLLTERIGMDRIIGASPAMEKVKTVVRMAAPSDAAVLLTGETGTGKSLLAQVIHEISPRRAKPFVKVDCSALPESLIEAELFGFRKGAFTGAVRDSAGRFEQAEGGTIFLDEIGNIPKNIQAKLLTVLQDLKVQPIGAARPVKVDVRIITATNADLSALVEGGAFRKDLYFRLNVIQVHLPPLREMADDIPLLARHFLNYGFPQYPHRVKGLSPAAAVKMTAYSWPGNTRELYNTLLKSVVLGEKEVLDAEDILFPGNAGAGLPAAAAVSAQGRRKRLPLGEILTEIKACRGNIRWAAHNLGLARFTLYNRLKKAGIRVENVRPQ